MFFLRNYAYQNKYFIEYATQLYSKSDFNYKLLDYNFTNKIKLDSGRIVFFASSKGQVGCVLLTILSALLLLCAMVIVAIGKFEFVIKNHFIIAGSIFLPFVIFWIVHSISKDPLLFSYYSTSCVMWFVLAFIIFYLPLLLIKRVAVKEKK